MQKVHISFTAVNPTKASDIVDAMQAVCFKAGLFILGAEWRWSYNPIEVNACINIMVVAMPFAGDLVEQRLYDVGSNCGAVAGVANYAYYVETDTVKAVVPDRYDSRGGNQFWGIASYDWVTLPNDINGNARFVVGHYALGRILSDDYLDYDAVLKLNRKLKLGGSKYDKCSFGRGLVFQGDLRSTIAHIMRTAARYRNGV